MPHVVHRIILRCIETRTRCAAWFETEAADSADIKVVNEAHEYFIDILEYALRSRSQRGKHQHQVDLQLKQPPVMDLNPSNKFAGLVIEYIDESDLWIIVTDKLVSVPGCSSSTRDGEVYEPERDIELELPFIIFCIF